MARGGVLSSPRLHASRLYPTTILGRPHSGQGDVQGMRVLSEQQYLCGPRVDDPCHDPVPGGAGRCYLSGAAWFIDLPVGCFHGCASHTLYVCSCLGTG